MSHSLQGKSTSKFNATLNLRGIAALRLWQQQLLLNQKLLAPYLSRLAT